MFAYKYREKKRYLYKKDFAMKAVNDHHPSSGKKRRLS